MGFAPLQLPLQLVTAFGLRATRGEKSCNSRYRAATPRALEPPHLFQLFHLLHVRGKRTRTADIPARDPSGRPEYRVLPAI